MHGVALFEPEFLGALPSDHALNHVVADLDHDSSHDLAEMDLLDGAWQLVSRREFHTLISAENSEHSLTSYASIVSSETFQFAPKIRPAQSIQQILYARRLQMLLADHQIVSLAHQRNEVQPKHACHGARGQATIHS